MSFETGSIFPGLMGFQHFTAKAARFGIPLAFAFSLAIGAEVPPENFKIAFLGDQGLGAPSEGNLALIKREGAQALIHLGDFDYLNNPAAWEEQTDRLLGADFPQIAVIGNHDIGAWPGPQGYGELVARRLQKLGVSFVGEPGLQCAFHYKGILFVLTSPGVWPGDHAGFIRKQLAADSSLWRISAWHVNQSLMQVGTKPDEAGWEVYEESRIGGAIIATAHEHSYSRTYLLKSMINQTVASRLGPLRLRKGRTFAFVAGLGGGEIRPQYLNGHWWASIYTATQGASPGALFATFHVDGDPRKAKFYFKNIHDAVIDSFTVISEVDKPNRGPFDPPPRQPRVLQWNPADWHLPKGGNLSMRDISGRTLVSTENFDQTLTYTVQEAGIVILEVQSGNRRMQKKMVVLP